MSKAVRAVIFGVLVAVAVSAAMAYLDAVTGKSDMTTDVIIGAVFGAITAYVFGNLAGNRSIANAGNAERATALIRTPPPGKMLLYIQREGFVAKMAGLNIAIDGRPVAQLKAPRFTLIVVPARQTTLSAGFGGLAGPQNRAGEIVIDPPPGGIAVVKIAVAMGLVQGSLRFTVQPNPQGARAALATIPMTPADVPEI